jgi:hypothetical protein
MRRRRGRPRKAGRRHPSGDLRREAETPRQVAARMPHRKGLGEKATDQRAETELGRLVLRGALDVTQGLAGETYLSLWRGYVFSLAGPSELSHGGGHGFTCDGCVSLAARKWCRCEFRKRIYMEARRVLSDESTWLLGVVSLVVLHDRPCLAGELNALRVGLSVLAQHFGLTPRANSNIGKCSIEIVAPGRC